MNNPFQCKYRRVIPHDVMINVLINRDRKEVLRFIRKFKPRALWYPVGTRKEIEELMNEWRHEYGSEITDNR